MFNIASSHSHEEQITSFRLAISIEKYILQQIVNERTSNMYNLMSKFTKENALFDKNYCCHATHTITRSSASVRLSAFNWLSFSKRKPYFPSK